MTSEAREPLLFLAAAAFSFEGEGVGYLFLAAAVVVLGVLVWLVDRKAKRRHEKMRVELDATKTRVEELASAQRRKDECTTSSPSSPPSRRRRLLTARVTRLVR